MFGIKIQSSTEKKLSQMNQLIMKSFSNVKNDTQKLFQWINYIHQKNQSQDNQIKQLKLEISYIPKNPDDIRKIIDTYYSFDNILERIKMMDEKINNIAETKSEPSAPSIHPGLNEIEQRISHLE